MTEYKYLSYSKLLEEACFSNVETKDEIRFDRIDIQEARIKYWGSFLSALWHALSHADMVNATKIIDTWNNYIIEYFHEGLLNCKLIENND